LARLDDGGGGDERAWRASASCEPWKHGKEEGGRTHLRAEKHTAERKAKSTGKQRKNLN
jgi:hypothetical protein